MIEHRRFVRHNKASPTKRQGKAVTSLAYLLQETFVFFISSTLPHVSLRRMMTKQTFDNNKQHIYRRLRCVPWPATRATFNFKKTNKLLNQNAELEKIEKRRHQIVLLAMHFGGVVGVAASRVRLDHGRKHLRRRSEALQRAPMSTIDAPIAKEQERER